LLSPRKVAELDGVCLAEVYLRLQRGEYEAVKDGRLTRIPVSSVMRRRERLAPRPGLDHRKPVAPGGGRKRKAR